MGPQGAREGGFPGQPHGTRPPPPRRMERKKISRQEGVRCDITAEGTRQCRGHTVSSPQPKIVSIPNWQHTQAYSWWITDLSVEGKQGHRGKYRTMTLTG